MLAHRAQKKRVNGRWRMTDWGVVASGCGFIGNVQLRKNSFRRQMDKVASYNNSGEIACKYGSGDRPFVAARGNFAQTAIARQWVMQELSRAGFNFNF
jgi:hypothetical protein